MPNTQYLIPILISLIYSLSILITKKIDIAIDSKIDTVQSRLCMWLETLDLGIGYYKVLETLDLQKK